LSIPASELSIRVWARGKRKAGKKLPARLISRKLLIFLRVRYLRFRSEKGRKQIHVIIILKPATCRGVNDFSPSLISIYDDPQTKARRISTEA
jgi:hypothetical protein